MEKSTSRFSDSMKKVGLAIYKWMGMTSGSWTDVSGNHMRVGKVFLERGELDEALRRFKLAAWINKRIAKPHALMVEAYAAMGEKEKAEQSFQKASIMNYENMAELRELIANIDKQDQQQPSVAEDNQTEKALEQA